jgi:GT2 family glycosyltransferase
MPANNPRRREGEDRLTPDRHEMRRQLAALQERVSRNGAAASHAELEALAGLVQDALARIDSDEKRWTRRHAELERRLLAIEHSRMFRGLRFTGNVWREWKGRLGQALLASPWHAWYVKLARPRRAADAYRQWLENEQPPAERALARQPLLSILLPLHNARREWLEAAVESVRRQSYPCWQLCVCDDASDSGWAAAYFAALSAAEPRIRFVRAAAHAGISGASNLAAELADGEYTAFLDQDDLLAPFALYAIAEAVQDGEPVLLYSDHDYLNSAGERVQPIFKPAYSPDLLRCSMYFGHLLVVRTKELREAGGLRPEYDGSQDYDLALRLTEKPALVRHIPRMLYHWRQHAGSTALDAGAKPFTQAAGQRALTEVVRRRDPNAQVEAGALANTYRVRWPVPPDLKASLIITSRNAGLLGRCLRAIEEHTAHANRELVIVQHRTGDTRALDRLLERQLCVRVPYTGPFNFAVMNNLAARQASGDVLVFLNDDVEPLHAAWLEEMLAHARRWEAGVVGARLVYPSGAIQHAGIAVGIMDGAGHLHRHTFAADDWKWLPFTRNVSAVTGTCLAIRKSVFEELGGFDEAFPVNYNDVDLCLRAREAGYEVIVEPAALLRHYECQSRAPGVRLEERDLFEQRWAEWLERGDPFYSPHLTRSREDAGLETGVPADLTAR